LASGSWLRLQASVKRIKTPVIPNPIYRVRNLLYHIAQTKSRFLTAEAVRNDITRVFLRAEG
jgi:hypothetical protein